MNNKARFNLLFLFIAASGVLLVHDLWVRSQSVAVIPYSRFQQLLEEKKVKEVLIDADSIQGELKEPLQEAPYQGRQRFVTTRVSPELATSLEKHGVTFAGRVESPWLHTLLSWVVPVLLFAAAYMWIGRPARRWRPRRRAHVHRQEQGQGLRRDRHPRSRFADVAGVDEAKAELEEVVSFLKDPKTLRPARRPHAQGRPARRARRAPARRCSPGRWPARRRCPSSPSAAPSSWRCSSAWARRACATSSSRRGSRRPASSSSTSSTPWGAPAAPTRAWAGTTRRSRR